MLVGVFILGCIVIGVAMANVRARLLTRIFVLAAIFCFSLFLLCLPYFTDDPKFGFEPTYPQYF